MSADFRSISGPPPSSVTEVDDDVSPQSTWTEIVVTVAATAIAVLLVSFVAVVMGMA
jgi:hypothetical protein